MKLYKYYPPENFDFIFLTSGISLRFSQREVLNDPFELKSFFDEHPQSIKFSIEEAIKLGINPDSLTIFHSIIDTYDLENFAEVIDKTNREYGILSFSRKKDHRSLWAYYSKDHTGFMVEIDHKNIKLPKEKYFKFGKVNYHNTMPKNQDKILESFFIKDHFWKHENEYRWVAPLSFFESKKDKNTRYPIYTHFLERKYINSVVVGFNASEELKNKILDWSKKFDNPVPVYSAVPSKTDYKFDYNLI